MNRDEFDQWLTDYGRSFPSLPAWLAALPDKGREMIRLWAETLADVDLRDCLAVTARIRLGDDQPIEAFHRENTPGIIRQRAIQQAVRRRARDAAAKAPKSPYRDGPPGSPAKSGWSAVALLKAILERKEGETIEEVAAQLLPESDDRRDWYACRYCRDTGIVDVWHPRSLQAIANAGELLPSRDMRRCVIGCACDAAERFPAMVADGKPRFAGRDWSLDRWCPVDVGGDALLGFAKALRERGSRPQPVYVGEFDEFNRRGEF